MLKRNLGGIPTNFSEVILGGRDLTTLKWKASVDMVNAAIAININLMETSADYGNSEDRIGDAFLIPKFNKSVYFISRAAVYDAKEMMVRIDASLGKLKCKPIEIYCIADLDEENVEQALGPGGALSALTRAKNSKKIRNLGWMTRSTAVAERMLKEVVFDVGMIPFSCQDRAFAEAGIIKKAKKQNLGLVALDALGTGGDRNVFLALKYMQLFPGVIPVIDVTTQEKLQEIDTFLRKKEFDLTPEEAEQLGIELPETPAEPGTDQAPEISAETGTVETEAVPESEQSGTGDAVITDPVTEEAPKQSDPEPAPPPGPDEAGPAEDNPAATAG